MARTIRISDIANYAENQLEKLVRTTVLETDRRLKEASPVDTGRFRSSWQTAKTERDQHQIMQATGYSIYNNLPYAEPLARGSSKQTADLPGGQGGWIEGIAKDMQSFVRTNASRIGRES
jgi:hypothetical protein